MYEKIEETSKKFVKTDFPLNIAIVTDEFMFNYYNGAFENLYYVNPDNYKLVFDNHKIDAFLYVLIVKVKFINGMVSAILQVIICNNSH